MAKKKLVKADEKYELMLNEIEDGDIYGGVSTQGTPIFPFVKIIEAKSPAKKVNLELKDGDVTVTDDFTKLNGEDFICLKFMDEYIIWGEENNILHRTQDINDPKLNDLTGGVDLWKYHTIYIIGYFPKLEKIAIIPFAKTRFKQGNTILKTCKIAGKKAILKLWKINTKEESKGKNDYFVYNILPNGMVSDPETVKNAIAGLKAFSNMSLEQIMTGGQGNEEVSGDPLEVGEDEEASDF